MTAIRKHAKEALAVLGLVAVAAGVSLYILDQQRMRFPWEESPLRLKAEFATAQAVTAGPGPDRARRRASASATSARSSSSTARPWSRWSSTPSTRA